MGDDGVYVSMMPPLGRSGLIVSLFELALVTAA
jgi:hypothetical protein